MKICYFELSTVSKMLNLTILEVLNVDFGWICAIFLSWLLSKHRIRACEIMKIAVFETLILLYLISRKIWEVENFLNLQKENIQASKNPNFAEFKGQKLSYFKKCPTKASISNNLTFLCKYFWKYSQKCNNFAEQCFGI